MTTKHSVAHLSLDNLHPTKNDTPTKENVQNIKIFISLFQTGIAQLRSGAHEFPISLDTMVAMLEPVVEHACTIAGLE